MKTIIKYTSLALILVIFGCNTSSNEFENKKISEVKESILKTKKVFQKDFTLNFPLEFNLERSITQLSGIGKVELINIFSGNETDIYMLNYNDIPDGVLNSKNEIEDFYKDMVTAIIADFGIDAQSMKELLIFKEVDYKGEFGIEFSFKSKITDGIILGRVFLIDNTVYFFMTSSDKMTEENDEFIKSFEILK